MSPENRQDDDSMEFDFDTVDERSSRENEDEQGTEVVEEPDEDVQEEPEETAEQAAAEPEEEEEPAAEGEGQGAAEADAAQQAAAQMMADLDIHAVLRMMIGMVAEQAWISLGLRVPEGAEEPKLDLDGARVAIDTLEFIQQKLEPKLEADENRELKTLISNLQMNFVQKS